MFVRVFATPGSANIQQNDETGAGPPPPLIMPALDTVESVKRFSESAQVFGASGSGPRSSVDVAA
jgi:hypothetical protein